MRPVAILLGLFLLFTAFLAAQGSDACGVCHSRFFEQWKTSAHAAAWTSQTFQDQMTKMGQKEFCATCHAPMSVWEEVNLKEEQKPDLLNPAAPPVSSDFTPVVAKKLKARTAILEDGVNCSACHQIQVFSPAGKHEEFGGPYHTAEGHGGKETAEFRPLRLCGACHGRPAADYLPEGAAADPTYYHANSTAITFDEGKVDCANCHMPRKNGKTVQLRAFKTLPLREVGDHSFAANRYSGLAEALEISASGTALKLTNLKVGHPVHIRRDTEFELSVSALRGTQAVGKHSQPVFQIGELGAGQSLEVPLPFTVQAGDVVTVKVTVKEGSAAAKPAFEKKVTAT